MKFVARPDQLPRSEVWLYARPHDASDAPEQSWRQRLVTYNMTGHGNPFVLLEAYRLYQNPVYAELVATLGASNVFILSAGWGLVRAEYLLPVYDITFSKSADKPAERYKFRRPHDRYNDFCHLHGDETASIVFFGCRDYLPLLQELTDPLRVDMVVFHATADPPNHLRWRLVRFPTRKFRNWHYDCVRAFLEGKVSI